jgi:hypothetical protein
MTRNSQKYSFPSLPPSSIYVLSIKSRAEVVSLAVVEKYGDE